MLLVSAPKSEWHKFCGKVILCKKGRKYRGGILDFYLCFWPLHLKLLNNEHLTKWEHFGGSKRTFYDEFLGAFMGGSFRGHLKAVFRGNKTGIYRQSPVKSPDIKTL